MTITKRVYRWLSKSFINDIQTYCKDNNTTLSYFISKGSLLCVEYTLTISGPDAEIVRDWIKYV